MNKLIFSLILIGLSLTMMECKSKKPLVIAPVQAEVVAIAQKRWPSVTQADLDNGRKIFVTRCTKCHGKKVITKKKEEGWQKTINRMAPRARLTPAEKETLTHYIFAMREAGLN